MSDSEVVNSALAKVDTGKFLRCDHVALEVAIATVAFLDANSVGAAGSVGCLRRTNDAVIGFSSRLAHDVKNAFSASYLNNNVRARVKNVHQVPTIYLSYSIAETIANVMGTEKCAEKYIYSSRGGGAPNGMAVLWYGGKDSYAPDAQALLEYVPDKYDCISCERFQYMKPCSDCVRCSQTMVTYTWS
jgi:hypothetical protein